MRIALLALSLTLLSTTTSAQTTEPEVRTLAEGQAPAPARIADLAWMAGRWRAAGLGGQVEEAFSPPADGQMVGHFRLTTAAGKAQFYQFVVVREQAGSLAYRLKHFSPDGRAWEDKERWLEFPLVAMSADTVFFSGLTLTRVGPGRMDAHLRMQDAKGASRIEVFRFERQP